MAFVCGHMRQCVCVCVCVCVWMCVCVDAREGAALTVHLQIIYLYYYTHTCTHYRDVSNIRGFSRETLNALLADIESREWRREFNIREGIPLEHPRASTTDDIECFFSVLRDGVGKDFTLKEVHVHIILHQ